MMNFKKVEIINGLYKITGRRIAMRHRLHIGTIVSDAMMKVKFLSGGYVGVIEEYFISRLNPGDVVYAGWQKPRICNDKGYDGDCKKIQCKKIHCTELEWWTNAIVGQPGSHAA